VPLSLRAAGSLLVGTPIGDAPENRRKDRPRQDL